MKCIESRYSSDNSSPSLPEHDAQELLSLSLLVFQRHDEVSYAAAGAVIIHVFLDACERKSVLGQTQQNTASASYIVEPDIDTHSLTLPRKCLRYARAVLLHSRR